MRPESALRKAYTTQFYRGNRLPFCLALLATALVSLINLLLSWLLQQLIDTASGWSQTYTLPQLFRMTLGALAAIVAAKTLSYLSQPRFTQKAMEQYKNYVFHKLTQKSIASFTQESTAAYLSALSNDAATIERSYVVQSFDLLFNCVMMVSSLVMMLCYSPLLMAVAVMLSLLPMGAALLSGNRMEAIEHRVSARNESFLASLKDTLAGFPVVKSFGAEAAMARLFRENNSLLEAEKCNKRKLGVSLGILGSTASVSAQFGTLLIGLLFLELGVPITPGVLIIFADLVGSVIQPLNNLPGLWAERKAAQSLIDKLAKALETNVREEGIEIPPILEDAIRLQNVCFSYEEAHPILHNLTTSFKSGKSYAIVGASGSGKSTLLNLLMGSYSSYSGCICYDSQELRTITSKSLYNLVTMIQQNVFVFNDTIGNNITLYRQFPEEAVQSAICRSGLSALMAQKGCHALCGENGSGLSGGEKQRISIARGLLRKASVLLVDEATAALDPETAWHVSDSILNLRGLTRIVVTHTLDPALLKRYDKILVLKKGRIQEEGTYDTLMAEKGYFYSLLTISQ